MLAYTCIIIVLLLTAVTGSTLRKKCAQNPNIPCLAMSVVMTQSTLVGILTAHFLPDMVLSTIIAITISFILTSYLTFGLEIRTFIDSLGALFMGAMMGAMLNLMTTSYLYVSFIFFTAIFIATTVFAITLLLKDDYNSIIQAIPKQILISVIVSVLCLVIGSVSVTISTPTKKIESEAHHQHH